MKKVKWTMLKPLISNYSQAATSEVTLMWNNHLGKKQNNYCWLSENSEHSSYIAENIYLRASLIGLGEVFTYSFISSKYLAIPSSSQVDWGCIIFYSPLYLGLLKK